MVAVSVFLPCRSRLRLGLVAVFISLKFVATLISSASQHRRRLVCRRLSRLAASVSSPSSYRRRLDLVAVLISSPSWHRRRLGRQSCGRLGFVAVFIAWLSRRSQRVALVIVSISQPFRLRSRLRLNFVAVLTSSPRWHCLRLSLIVASVSSACRSSWRIDRSPSWFCCHLRSVDASASLLFGLVAVSVSSLSRTCRYLDLVVASVSSPFGFRHYLGIVAILFSLSS